MHNICRLKRFLAFQTAFGYKSRNACVLRRTSIKLGDKINKIWITPAGLDYGLHRKDGNRIKHVLKHTVPNIDKRLHTVFSVSRKEMLPLIDEAWKKKGMPLANDPRTYLVDMKRVIGTNGETKIHIVVQTKGSNQITTAYPQK